MEDNGKSVAIITEQQSTNNIWNSKDRMEERSSSLPAHFYSLSQLERPSRPSAILSCILESPHWLSRNARHCLQSKWIEMSAYLSATAYSSIANWVVIRAAPPHKAVLSKWKHTTAYGTWRACIELVTNNRSIWSRAWRRIVPCLYRACNIQQQNNTDSYNWKSNASPFKATAVGPPAATINASDSSSSSSPTYCDSAFLSPVNGVRQTIAGRRSIPVALALHYIPASVPFGAEVSGTVLLVGDIREPVQSELVRPVLEAVLLVDVLKVVLEDLKPLVLLVDGVVRFAVFHQPRLEHLLHLVLAPDQALRRMLLVVGYDRHVLRRRGNDGEQKREENQKSSHGWKKKKMGVMCGLKKCSGRVYFKGRYEDIMANVIQAFAHLN
nr:hypothetical protein Iba_chr01bCG17220 [Ipomoea batatas]